MFKLSILALLGFIFVNANEVEKGRTLASAMAKISSQQAGWLLNGPIPANETG